MVDEKETVKDFNSINNASNLNWAFSSQLTKFIKRFWNNPYRKEDTAWIQKLANENAINVKEKLLALRKLI